MRTYWEIDLRSRKNGNSVETIFSGEDYEEACACMNRWYEEHPDLDIEAPREAYIDGEDGVFADIYQTTSPHGVGKWKDDTLKCGDIVVYKEQIGIVVKSGELLKFKECNSGCCSYSSLDSISEREIRRATEEEKIEYIKREFSWGKIRKVHCIGEYQIIEYMRTMENRICYHGYINYRDTNVGYYSLDSALIGCIGMKYEGGNGKAAMYFEKMIGINTLL